MKSDNGALVISFLSFLSNIEIKKSDAIKYLNALP